MKRESARIAIENQASHGEGPVWDPYRNRLFWVDLTAGRLHMMSPSEQAHESVAFDEPICAVAPLEDGRILAAFAKRLAYVRWPAAEVEEIVAVEPDKPGNRCNDGKLDPGGRFWIGTMSNDGSVDGAGSLYRLEHDRSLTRVLDNLTVANGMGWSPDSRTMYFIDSPEREVWAFDFDVAVSSISRKRIAIRIPEELGVPDGMTVDSEGMLWIAQWGGSCVCKWDPGSGKLLLKVMTGCPHTSSCAFGGKDGSTLFITTSRQGLSDQALRAHPRSGALFCYKPTR